MWGDDASDSDADASGQTDVFTVTGDDLTRDAGLLPLHIGDFVFRHDVNGDGVQDVGEPGVEGVVVELLDDVGGSLDTTVTDGDGRYSFVVSAGDYGLQITLPVVFGGFSPQGCGRRCLGQRCRCRRHDRGLYGGRRRRQPGRGGWWTCGSLVIVFGAIPTRTVSRTGETQGVANVVVTLFDDQGIQLDQTQTDSDGSYGFAVAEGEYYLQFIAPAGHGFSPQNAGDDTVDSDAASDGLTVVFSITDADATWDAGLTAPPMIGDRIWYDDNLNGIQDGGESGAPGVSVELFTEEGISQGTTTTAMTAPMSFRAWSRAPTIWRLRSLMVIASRPKTKGWTIRWTAMSIPPRVDDADLCAVSGRGRYDP